MVITKRSSKKPVSKASMKRMRITVVHPIGPFSSMAALSAQKAKVKGRVSHATFTPAKKTSRGFFTSVKTSYVKSVAATTAQVKAHLQSHSPDAKISVNYV